MMGPTQLDLFDMHRIADLSTVRASRVGHIVSSPTGVAVIFYRLKRTRHWMPLIPHEGPSTVVNLFHESPAGLEPSRRYVRPAVLVPLR